MPRWGPHRAVMGWLLVCVMLNAVGQILFKAARVGDPDGSLVSAFFRPETWGGFIVYGLSAVCWLWVLSRMPLSIAYPLLSLSFPIVVGLSAIIFAESISSVRWAGVGLIVVGVSMMART